MSSMFGRGADYQVDAAELRLRQEQEELLKLSRQKISFSSELYDSLDGHVRRLDASLKKYEAKLRKGGFEISAAPLDFRRRDKKNRAIGIGGDPEAREIALRLEAEMRDDIERGSSSASEREQEGAEAGSDKGSSHRSEPLYCTCRKVSYGAMVACDNQDCEIEWFHFACVGLDTKPRGKWFCNACREKKNKRQRMSLSQGK